MPEPGAAAVRRILVVRLSALGDVVMASGLIPALRALWPGAHIAWLVEPAAAPLLAHNPRLDEVIVWPRAEWQRLWRERRLVELWRRWRALRQRLRAGRYDMALDLQGLLKSGVWTWASGAPRRLSLIGREGSHRLATERVVPTPPADGTRPIGAEYRHLARHLGAADADFRLDLAVGAAPRETAAARLAAVGLAPGARYAVLCPFTTRPQKHWFDDRWQALARRLQADGLVQVLLGGPGDRDAAAGIAASVPGLLDLTGRLALDESAAAVAGAALLVGVDTGLTHMGSALGVPTLALFGSTRPYLDGGPRTRVLYEPLACAPCRRHPTCGGRHDCMRALEVEQVAAAARALLGAP